MAHPLVQWAGGKAPWSAALEDFTLYLRDELFPACGIDLLQAGRAGAQLLIFVIGMAKDFDKLWGYGHDADTPVHQILLLTPEVYNTWLHFPQEAYEAFKTRPALPEDVRDMTLPIRTAPTAPSSTRDLPSHHSDGQTLEKRCEARQAGVAEDGSKVANNNEEMNELDEPVYHTKPTAEEQQAVRVYAEAMIPETEANGGTLPETFNRPVPPWLKRHAQASAVARETSSDDHLHRLTSRLTDIRMQYRQAKQQATESEGTDQEAYLQAKAYRWEFHWCLAYFDRAAYNRTLP